LSAFFANIKLHEPNSTDTFNLLKALRDELEKFHHVVIPDETRMYGLSMANHYLSGQQGMEKTLQLIDSAAARIGAQQQDDKPVVTNSALAHIIASWTHIPVTHLQHNKFKAFDFMQSLQKSIFGQDAAISLIALALQYARIKLHNKTGALVSFLFAGPPHVGKTETALCIAEQLFGHKNALLRISLDKNSHPLSLAEIRVSTPGEETTMSLYEAIQQTPYAVVLLENINHAPHGTLDLFYDLLMQGCTQDEKGNKYDFRHAIVIITTTLGAERIIRLTQPAATSDAAQAVDLMQLVLNEPVQDNAAPQQPNLSPQELCEEMMPALQTYFSPTLLRQLNIVPFTLLDYAGIEKIVRLKLKALAKQLDNNFGIELIYTPEVTRFLVQENLWRGEATRPIDKTLEQHLYSCVAHELLTHMEDKSRTKRLQLQLNDAGQLLRCEFMMPAEASMYQL
jgi:ATP-dependent Clp protease ATP-binding subunit ClpC